MHLHDPINNPSRLLRRVPGLFPTVWTYDRVPPGIRRSLPSLGFLLTDQGRRHVRNSIDLLEVEAVSRRGLGVKKEYCRV